MVIMDPSGFFFFLGMGTTNSFNRMGPKPDVKIVKTYNMVCYFSSYINIGSLKYESWYSTMLSACFGNCQPD